MVASVARIARLWLGALISAAAAYGVKRVLPFHRPELVGCVRAFGLRVGLSRVHQAAGDSSPRQPDSLATQTIVRRNKEIACQLTPSLCI